MSHQPLSTILFRPVFVYSIVLLLAVGGILVIVPLFWGVPVLELDPRMEVKLPPPTLEEVSNSLRKG